MAENYKMGQYRFTPGTCTENLTNIFSAQPLYIPTMEGSSSVYQDVCIRTNTPEKWQYFNDKESYYLSMKIPQNLNYDLELVVKMISCADTRNYQILKKIIVPRKSGESRMGKSRVCLWEKTEESGDLDPRVNIPIYFSRAIDSNGDFVYNDSGIINLRKEENENSEKVIPAIDMLLYRPGESYRYISSISEDGSFITSPVSGSNDVILLHSWENVENDNLYAFYEFVFSPKISNEEVLFDAIHIDMIRISEDTDIIEDEITINGNSRVLCGRYIDLDNFVFNLYHINKILPPKNVSSCNRIGVWGPSGLLMSINGEPVRVGPSGYYELKDFEVTSFGVFAPDIDDENVYANNFTVDYQYLA